MTTGGVPKPTQVIPKPGDADFDYENAYYDQQDTSARLLLSMRDLAAQNLALLESAVGYTDEPFRKYATKIVTQRNTFANQVKQLTKANKALMSHVCEGPDGPTEAVAAARQEVTEMQMAVRRIAFRLARKSEAVDFARTALERTPPSDEDREVALAALNKRYSREAMEAAGLGEGITVQFEQEPVD